MKTSYRIKDMIFPALIPVAVPVLGVPISLVLSSAIHTGQTIRREWIHRGNRRRGTPTSIPEGAGGQVRTQDDAVSRLPLHDFAPLPIDGYSSTGIRALPDIAPMYFDSGRILRGRLHAYPRHFHETLIPGAGGTPISAMLGLHHSKLRRPGLLIVHGLMNSKRQDLVRIVTLRAYYEWGFNVCAIDLRGFGRSAELASAPSGAGGIETEDVMSVLRYLRGFSHFTSLGLLGFSLGGGTVLNAAAHKDAEALIDGGVMAISPPINFEAALERFEQKPPDEEHLLTFHFFRYLLQRSLKHAEIMKWVKRKLKASGQEPKVESFYDYLQNLVALGYLGQGHRRELSPDKLLELLLKVSSPRRSLPKVKVPTFILHAKDDPLCQINGDDIAFMARVANANPHFRYHVTELGGHTAYVVVNPSWFYKMVGTYFTYWGQWETSKRDPFEGLSPEALGFGRARTGKDNPGKP
ncbi:MAG: alpha/beta fold hydrolase [Myxococcota bacterium]